MMSFSRPSYTARPRPRPITEIRSPRPKPVRSTPKASARDARRGRNLVACGDTEQIEPGKLRPKPGARRRRGAAPRDAGAGGAARRPRHGTPSTESVQGDGFHFTAIPNSSGPNWAGKPMMIMCSRSRGASHQRIPGCVRDQRQHHREKIVRDLHTLRRTLKRTSASSSRASP